MSPLTPSLSCKLGTALTLAILTACQGLTRGQVAAEYRDDSCLLLGADFRQAVSADGVENAASVSLPGAPLLHSNRFLSSLASDAQQADQRQELIALLALEGIAMREVENENLRRPWPPERMQRLADCTLTLAEAPRYESLRQDVVQTLTEDPLPDDHYLSARQWLGALPLLKPVFSWRIRALHREEQRWFSDPEQFADTVTYRPAVADTRLAPQTIRDWFVLAYDGSELGLPRLPESRLQQLFAHYAPSLNIELGGDNDLLGTPVWRGAEVHIDTAAASLYTHASFTRLADAKLLQLNYVFWFPSRQPLTPLDLYAGRFDGIVWRVTLGRDGQALMYDSIHNCGCYHKYFLASPKLRSRLEPRSAEPANIFDLNALDHRRPLRLTLTANEHFIVGIDNETAAAFEPYQLKPYDRLYRLPRGQDARSMFDDRGLVPGSERLERYTLWPSGIVNVGAMRQWGTHATGFVARQHFDDADLFDRYFEWVPAPEP